MERLATWLWQRWPTRFRIVLTVVAIVLVVAFIDVTTAALLPIYYGSTAADALRFFAVQTAVNVVVVTVGYLAGLSDAWSRIDAWTAGDRRDPAGAMDAALSVGRHMVRRAVLFAVVAYTVTTTPFWARLGELSLAGALSFHLASLGASFVAVMLLGSTMELLLRPLRAEISTEFPDAASGAARRPVALAVRIAAIGGAFAWTTAFVIAGVVSLFDAPESRWAAATIGGALLVAVYGTLFLYSTALIPVLRPIGDLTVAANRVREGVFTQPVPVTSDDDLGALSVAFNRMQSGLRERERLQAAFGSYVDPALASRLLADDTERFSGERVEVTALFVDIRDFTSFAEANAPEQVVSRLSELFDAFVPVIAAHGGHTNKFLGDGALAVFGTPEVHVDHADRAVAAAGEMARRVAQRFGESVRIGIGINSGDVIAGTIGGGGKLEFTIIGDAVNVAARVEQLTKVTGDQILLTDDTMTRLQRSHGTLRDRGFFELKGKRNGVRVHAYEPAAEASAHCESRPDPQ